MACKPPKDLLRLEISSIATLILRPLRTIF